MNNKAKQMAYRNAVDRWQRDEANGQTVSGDNENETENTKTISCFCQDCRSHQNFISVGLTPSGRWERFECTGDGCIKSVTRPAPKRDVLMGNFFVQSLRDNPDENKRGLTQTGHEWLTELGISPIDESDQLSEKNHVVR